MNIKITQRRKEENNRQYAYRLLRDSIMTLHLLPGTSINEGELSELLKVSRTPVREAVIMLKEESLVEVYPQSGSRVSMINIGILKEGYFMRSIIEPEILKEMAGKLSKEQMLCLKENILKQEEVLQQEEQIDAFFKLDDTFHRIIYAAAAKDKIWYAMKKVSTHYDRVRYLDAIMNHTDLSQILQEHKRIYHMLLIGLSRDVDIRNFYDRHLGTFQIHFQEILEKNEDYFVL